MKLVWDKQVYENVRVLLDAESPFPNEFDLCGIQNSENRAALLKQVEERRSFQQSMNDVSQNIVIAFIRNHRAYDPSKQSALMTAVKRAQSEGFSSGTDEQLT